MNKVSLFVKALSAMAIGIALINPAKANAQWIDLGRDALGQWGEAIRFKYSWTHCRTGICRIYV